MKKKFWKKRIWEKEWRFEIDKEEVWRVKIEVRINDKGVEERVDDKVIEDLEYNSK